MLLTRLFAPSKFPNVARAVETTHSFWDSFLSNQNMMSATEAFQNNLINFLCLLSVLLEMDLFCNWFKTVDNGGLAPGIGTKTFLSVKILFLLFKITFTFFSLD